MELVVLYICSPPLGLKLYIAYVPIRHDLCNIVLFRHSALNKKYITKICEGIEELLSKR